MSVFGYDVDDSDNAAVLLRKASSTSISLSSSKEEQPLLDGYEEQSEPPTVTVVADTRSSSRSVEAGDSGERTLQRRRSQEAAARDLADHLPSDELSSFASNSRMDGCYFYSEDGPPTEWEAIASGSKRAPSLPTAHTESLTAPSLFAQDLMAAAESPGRDQCLSDDDDESDSGGFIASVSYSTPLDFIQSPAPTPPLASAAAPAAALAPSISLGAARMAASAGPAPAAPAPSAAPVGMYDDGNLGPEILSPAPGRPASSSFTMPKPTAGAKAKRSSLKGISSVDGPVSVSKSSDGIPAEPATPGSHRKRSVSNSQYYYASSMKGNEDVAMAAEEAMRLGDGSSFSTTPNARRRSRAGSAASPPPLSVAAAANSGGYQHEEDWNTEFQAALDMAEGSDKWNRLSQLARDFVYCSKTYGKIIISEYYLPDKQKTIPTLKGNTGVAGGQKYLCSRIFFKFALDTRLSTTDAKGKKVLTDRWMYGGPSGPDDYAAMKAAKNEILGLLSFYNTNTKGLHYPLMSVIDYRGFRLIALSILPISKETLVYGSADGGKTVFASIPQMNLRMKEVARKLNTKGHRVGRREVLLHTPGDIEGHLGRDGKFYVIDFGRVFPPEAPSKRGREVFYNLLRPEFIRSYPVPLSSDAFTGFGHHSNHIHNKEVRAATQFLYNVTIPKFACSGELQELVHTDYFSDEFRLTERLHSSGVSCRHLGRVRAAVPVGQVKLRNLLLTEMAARTLTAIMRQMLREEMKKTAIAAREEPYKNLSLVVFNACLLPPEEQLVGVKMRETAQLTPESMAYRSFWTTELKPLLEKKFPNALTEEEKKDSFNLRSCLDIVYLMHRICQQTGVHWSDQAFKEFRAAPEDFRLMKFDLRKISARVQHLNVIDEAEGNLLFHEATKSNARTIRSGLWKATNQKFARAVASNTSNPVTFIRWGRILIEQYNRQKMTQGGLDTYLTQSRQLISAAAEKFVEARKLNFDLFQPHAMLGICSVNELVLLQLFSSLDSVASIKWLMTEATEHFQRAFTRSPYCYNNLAEEAKEAFDMAEELSKASVTPAEQVMQNHRIHILYSKAYTLLACILQVAPVKPDAYTFFLAGMSVYKYLVHGGQNRGDHWGGMAAMMLESALLIAPCASDASYAYVLHDGHDSSNALRRVGDGCVLRSVGVLSRENQGGDRQDGTKVMVPMAAETRLYVAPMATTDPRGSYDGTFVLNTLFHLLGSKSGSGHVHRIKREYCTFVLGGSVHDDFILSRVEIGIAPGPRPAQMILFGSDFMQPQLSPEEVGPRSHGGKGSTQRAGLKRIATIDISATAGDVFRVPVSQSFSARYLIVKLVPAKADDKEVVLSSLAFYGALVSHTDSDEEKLPVPGDVFEYSPPLVRWARQVDLSPKLHLCDSRVTFKVTKLSSILHMNQPAIVQANTPFTVTWTMDQAVTSPRAAVRAVVLWVESTGSSSIVNQQILRVAKRNFDGKLKVIHMPDMEAAVEWLSSQSNRGVHKMRKYRQFRIVADAQCANSPTLSASSGTSSDGTAMGLVEWIGQDRRWKEVPMLVFCRQHDRLDWPAMENVSHTNSVQMVIDFMSANGLDALKALFVRKMAKSHPGVERSVEGGQKLSHSAATVENIGESSWIGGISGPLHKAARAILSDSRSTTDKKATSNPEIHLRRSGNHVAGPFLYFEVLVERIDRHGSVSIGVTSGAYELQGSMAGFSGGSYALHSQDGLVHCGGEVGYCFANRKAHTFAAGDVVGCGYSLTTQRLFWTLNGVLLGYPEKGMSRVTTVTGCYLYPSVGFDRSSSVQANFGEQPFAFDPTVMIFSASLRGSKEEELLANPFPDLFADCVNHQGVYMMELFKIAGYSPTLEVLLRAHFSHRSTVVPYHSAEEVQIEGNLGGVYNVIDLHNTDISDDMLRGVCGMFPVLNQLNISSCFSLSFNALASLIESCEPPAMLDLSGNDQFTAQTAKTLAKGYQSLKALRVWEGITEAALSSSICSLTNLVALDLQRCRHLTDDALKSILTRRSMLLLSLNVAHCTQLTDRSLATIGKCPSTSELQKLNFTCCTQFSEKALIRVVSSCVSLRAISVAGNSVAYMNVSDSFVHALCRHTEGLRAINLYRCTQVTSDAITELGRTCTGLTEVDLGHCHAISDTAIAQIAQYGTSLRNLELFNTAVCDDTAKLFAIRHTQLQAVSLQRCRFITAEGCIGLIPDLQSVRFLSLKELGLTDELLLFIANCSDIESLTTLDISRSMDSLSAEAISTLMDKKPKVRVVHNQLDSPPVVTAWNLSEHSVSALRRRKNSL